MTQINLEQWEALKIFVSSENDLLWVTKGAQDSVTDPYKALTHGLFRVIRMEDANARLSTLDVQSSISPTTGIAIVHVLDYPKTDRGRMSLEREFEDLDGILYIHRTLPVKALKEMRESVPSQCQKSS